MNNLKFRAWHKEEKKYYEVSAIYFGMQAIYVNERSYQGYCYFDEIIIEQYTGLKDKNGKEIYVGDILKITLENTREIIFHLRDYKEFITESIYSAYYEFEIIGNIHENKELLD